MKTRTHIEFQSLLEDSNTPHAGKEVEDLVKHYHYCTANSIINTLAPKWLLFVPITYTDLFSDTLCQMKRGGWKLKHQ